VILAGWLAGCADGRELTEWTLRVDGEPAAVDVTLPSNLLWRLPMRETDYQLVGEYTPTAEERGKTLTLVIECFHAPVELRVDGVVVPDDGDTYVGEHRWTIGPPTTYAARSNLVLSARRVGDIQASLHGVPRLLIGLRGRSAVVTFNRYADIVVLLLSAFVGFLCACLYLFDREHKEYGVYAIGSACSVVLYFWLLGLVAPVFGSLTPAIIASTFNAANLCVLYFVHLAFQLGRPPRVWVWSWSALVALSFTAPLSVALATLGFLLILPVYVAFELYIVRALARLWMRGDRNAGALAFGYLILSTTSTFEFVEALASTNWLGGLHLQILQSIFLLSIAIVVSRQHLARRRDVELTSARLRRATEELQHQVAERSRELADALSKLSARPTGPIELGWIVDRRYRVVRRIGSGGMGTIHEVERLDDGERFALKTMRGHDDSQMLARFAREAQIAAELRHPNVVPVVDVGVEEGRLFLVMPLVEGGSLERERGRFGDAAWARGRLAQIATGLAAMHARGIVHRDLKPGNILIDGEIARISDFGLALLRADGDTPQTLTATHAGGALTHAGDLLGTPAYIAPELAGGIREALPSSDIFAFGVLGYEMIAGRPPFATAPVLDRLAGRDIPPPPPLEPRDALAALIERCLDLAPDRRPTAAELASALG